MKAEIKNLQVDAFFHTKLKEYCKANGLSLKWVTESMITEYLKEKR